MCYVYPLLIISRCQHCERLQANLVVVNGSQLTEGNGCETSPTREKTGSMMNMNISIIIPWAVVKYIDDTASRLLSNASVIDACY